MKKSAISAIVSVLLAFSITAPAMASAASPPAKKAPIPPKTAQDKKTKARIGAHKPPKNFKERLALANAKKPAELQKTARTALMSELKSTHAAYDAAMKAARDAFKKAMKKANADKSKTEAKAAKNTFDAATAKAKNERDAATKTAQARFAATMLP